MKIKFPYIRTRDMNERVRIEVMADSMRVGKTTAVKVIAEGLRKKGHAVTESYEDWQNNPYLKRSYSDPAKNFLASQKWFIKRKWEQIRDGAKVGVFIQDVSPEMDFCYAETSRRLGRMSDEHFKEYSEYFHSLGWKVAPAPNVLVYLSVSDEVLLQRALDSRREFEKVEPDYFLMMKRVNREWLEGARDNKEYRIMNIDTDKMDFAHNEKAKDLLVKQVIKKLNLT